MKYFYKKIIFGILIMFVFVSTANAMEVYFEKDSKQTSDGSILLNIFLNSDKQEINAMEGNITLDGPVGIVSVKKDRSIFSLWPEEPEVKSNEIHFVGGTPSGVFGTKLQILSFKIKPNDIGGIRLSLKDVNTFLNDGLGTQVKVSDTVYEFNVDEIPQISDSYWLKIIIGVIILLTIVFVVLFLKRKNDKSKL